MPFDAMAMAAAQDEMQEHVLGGQIQRILQPSMSTVALQVHAHGASRWLVASVDPRFARVHLTSNRLAKAFPTPSNFVMVLRKYIEGTRIVAVDQAPYERVLRLACGPEEHRTYLVAEVMSKHSNVILLDIEDCVLGALKIITSRQSRVRPIIPGRTYQLPPERGRDEALFGEGPRFDPCLCPDMCSSLLSRVPEGTNWRTALLGLFPGASPFLVEQICLRGSVHSTGAVSDAEIHRVVEAGAGLYQLYVSRTWLPHVFTNVRSQPDFCPYQPEGASDLIGVGSVGEAIERCFGSEESRDSLGSIRKAIKGDIAKALRSASRRVESLHEGLVAAEQADDVMQRGQLVLAYQWAVAPGAALLDIPDLSLQVPLDPSLSVKENAERLFRRYRKLRDAARRIPGLMSAGDADVARLQDLEVFADLADSESALRELQRQVANTQPAAPRKKTSVRRGPMRLRRNGARAVLGHNARENEEVTFHIAGRNDLWLHARGRTGAHVVLQCGAEDMNDATLEAAAALAAYYSEGRADTAVDVDVAAVRDVRKIPGGAPGRVTYRNARTIRVAPALEGWESDKR